ncbi:MAG: hemolysin family protein [Thermodesulfobacteriota bacterium]|nr:hemolysin family protein [Thermodesulfobacteriota bacterium]
MTSQIVILLVLLVLSGFFSSSETALFSLSRSKVRFLAKKQNRVDLLIKKMKEDPHNLLSTILIGNNLVNIGASALATAIAIEFFASNAVGIATGIMTFFILIFGEILPKSVATKNNILIARITIYPLYWLSLLFYPIIIFLNFIPRLTGKIKKAPVMTEEELKTIVEVTEEEGEINGEEKEFIHNIFKFDDTSASEIMTPTTDMFAVDVDKKLALGNVLKSGFTRIPVYKTHIGNIIGMLNIKDIFRQYASSNQIDISALMNKPYFIPESKKLNSLLKQFKIRKNHMAIVINEHGEVLGLITLEDVLEELVGDIIDETDKYEPHIVKVKNNTWLVLGKSHIEEVNERIPLNIPASKEYDTFSGYVLYKIGRIPEEKEILTIDNFDITVKSMQANRIISFIVVKKQDTPIPDVAAPS